MSVLTTMGPTALTRNKTSVLRRVYPSMDGGLRLHERAVPPMFPDTRFQIHTADEMAIPTTEFSWCRTLSCFRKNYVCRNFMFRVIPSIDRIPYDLS